MPLPRPPRLPISGPSRAFTLVEIMIVVVTIGLLAALAIPGFKKMAAASQDKAVLNNARQLASAAEQYFHESGFDFVDTADLIGPASYVKVLNPVAHELYPDTLFAATPLTVSGIAGARTVTYSP